MKTAAFRYDYACLPPDRQIGKHTQASWELAHVVRGGGYRTIGNKTEAITEGEIILIPPHISHGWEFDPSITDREGNITTITIFFDSSVLDGIEMVFPEAKQMVRKLKSITEAISYPNDTHNGICELLHSMRDLTPASRLATMLELLTLISDTDNCSSVGANTHLTKTEQRLEKIRVFCACNHAREFTLNEAATYVGMNKSAFCTFMRRRTGKSFSEYVNCYRLERSLERLRHTDDGIAEIAYDVGFTNVTYFNRLFKSRFGCTPKATREKR